MGRITAIFTVQLYLVSVKFVFVCAFVSLLFHIELYGRYPIKWFLFIHFLFMKHYFQISNTKLLQYKRNGMTKFGSSRLFPLKLSFRIYSIQRVFYHQIPCKCYGLTFWFCEQIFLICNNKQTLYKRNIGAKFHYPTSSHSKTIQHLTDILDRLRILPVWILDEYFDILHFLIQKIKTYISVLYYISNY